MRRHKHRPFPLLLRTHIRLLISSTAIAARRATREQPPQTCCRRASLGRCQCSLPFFRFSPCCMNPSAGGRGEVAAVAVQARATHHTLLNSTQQTTHITPVTRQPLMRSPFCHVRYTAGATTAAVLSAGVGVICTVPEAPTHTFTSGKAA